MPVCVPVPEIEDEDEDEDDDDWRSCRGLGRELIPNT